MRNYEFRHFERNEGEQSEPKWSREASAKQYEVLDKPALGSLGSGGLELTRTLLYIIIEEGRFSQRNLSVPLRLGGFVAKYCKMATIERRH